MDGDEGTAGDTSGRGELAELPLPEEVPEKALGKLDIKYDDSGLVLGMKKPAQKIANQSG